MKVGILGGSFDPIHKGHVHMALAAKKFLALDAVWLIPAGHSPNKEEQKMTPAENRYEMCRLAVSDLAGISVSRIEIDSAERSYTYRTLQKLTVQNPQHEFFFIMGADSLDYFEKWVHPEIISRLAHILVINRDAFTETDLNQKIAQLNARFSADITLIPCEKYPVSSSMLRARIAEGEPKPPELTDNVWEYICSHGLYKLV